MTRTKSVIALALLGALEACGDEGPSGGVPGATLPCAREGASAPPCSDGTASPGSTSPDPSRDGEAMARPAMTGSSSETSTAPTALTPPAPPPAPTSPPFDASRAGLWRGTTSQNLDLEFALAEDGTLLGMRFDMRMSLGTSTCTGPLAATATQRLSGDTFDVALAFPVGSVSTDVHGSFDAVGRAQGTYDGHSGGYLLACGGTLSFGSGSLFGDGTWSATQCASCALTCEFTGDGVCDEPDGDGTGLCYLGTDVADCCSTPRDGVCDDVSQGGACADGRDFYDCGECPFTSDDECDEASGTDLCPAGSDAVDCGPPICGDGFLRAPEGCDDGNTADGDGCSATCEIDGVFEAEPNDDGAIAIGSDDFALPVLLAPITSDTFIAAALTPAGDEDVFALSNTTQEPVGVRIETFGAGGVSTCPIAVDTRLTLRDADGLELATDDGAERGVCSVLTSTISPGTAVYVHVADSSDSRSIGAYFMQIAFE